MSSVTGISGFHIASVIWKLVTINQASSEGVPFLYDRAVFFGSPVSYGPPNPKMTIFLVVFEFFSNKSYLKVLFLFHFKNLHAHSFPTIPNLCGLGRVFKSYGPGSDNENLKTRKL